MNSRNSQNSPTSKNVLQLHSNKPTVSSTLKSICFSSEYLEARHKLQQSKFFLRTAKNSELERKGAPGGPQKKLNKDTITKKLGKYTKADSLYSFGRLKTKKEPLVKKPPNPKNQSLMGKPEIKEATSRWSKNNVKSAAVSADKDKKENKEEAVRSSQQSNQIQRSQKLIIRNIKKATDCTTPKSDLVPNSVQENTFKPTKNELTAN